VYVVLTVGCFAVECTAQIAMRKKALAKRIEERDNAIGMVSAHSVVMMWVGPKMIISDVLALLLLLRRLWPLKPRNWSGSRRFSKCSNNFATSKKK
jgi:hypothetical protein